MIEPDTILAGPIVRWTDRSRVTVWIASSSDPTRDASLLVFGAAGRGATPRSGQTKVQTVKVGPCLFVSLLAWIPSHGFEPGEELEYDVEIFERGLKDHGLLGRSGVAVAGRQRPSFVVPGPGQAILHASCRKLHGKGSDASVALDRMLRDPLSQRRRPGALFLTGDQVYADDVDRDVLLRIMRLSKDLVGAESLPGLSRVPGPGRQTILSQRARFTSREADNHLMTVGEFSAMYLLAWSPVLWGNAKFSPRIEDARQRVPELRRVLANVPTYMTFDDHEVTDDWYLDENWRNAVLETELGRHVVENGLLAFWLFQAWGNDPSTFGCLLPQVQALATARLSGGGSGAFLLDQNWSYLTPSRPAGISIDTRTSRANVKERMELVDDRGFARVSQLVAQSASDSDEPLIVVSPAPVFGFPVIEFLQSRFASLTGSSLLDFERWFPKAFERLLTTFRDAGVREIVILSGDIHYSLNVRAEVLNSDTAGSELAVYQLVSSALKNESPALEKWWAVALRAGQNARSALTPRKVRGLRTKHEGDIRFGWCVEKLDEGRSRFYPWRRLLPSNNAGRVVIEPDHVVHELHAPSQVAKAVVRMPRR